MIQQSLECQFLLHLHSHPSGCYRVANAHGPSLMLIKKPRKSPNIWATFVWKFVAENFKKSSNLVPLGPI